PPALSTPPPAYHHYIALEQAALSSPEHQNYWVQTLADARLPWWSTHPQRGAKKFYCPISPEMSVAMMGLAADLGVQEKSVWCAVYLALTALLDGGDSALGSVVTHGRPELAQAEKTIGLFLNSLPIHLRVRGRTWAELIALTDHRLQELQQHRHYPLARIQELVRLDFSASLFNFINFHVISDSSEQSKVGGTGDFGIDDTNYSFAVDVQKDEATHRHMFRVTVDPTVFDADFQVRIRRHVENIISAMMGDRCATIDPARMLGIEQQEILKLSRGGAPADYASWRAKCIHQLFEEQVEQQPGAIALTCAGLEMTYAELNRRANQLARHLRAQGVRCDDRIAICVERGFEMIVGLLGIMKAGGAYVPLDPSYPRERLEYILENAAPRVLLTQQRLNESLPSHGAAWVLLDSDWESIARHEVSNLDPAVVGLRADCLAYVIFTSGSTGHPKGVMVSHENVVNHNTFVRHEFALTAEDRMLQFASFCFDASVEEIFPILMAGGRLVLRTQSTPSAAELCEQVLSDGITLLDLPTAYWHVWVNSIDAEYLNRSAVRLLIVGGETASADSLQKWKQIAAPRQLWVNTYGPTEATIICTTYVDRAAGLDRAVPIGAPISNTRIYICDERGDFAPVGVPGEIVIGGAGVARGYSGRPALTAERFVPDPFGPAGSRVYKSGDLGRWRADGMIEYLGRNDRQVKIRGYRVELGEIESKLHHHASIKEAIVVAREDVPGEISLVAYIGCGADAPPDPQELRKQLLASLPGYMVPSAFVVLEKLPLTRNGKVDLKALPAPAAAVSLAYDEPQGEIEAILAGIWLELLRVPRVGRNDNFFELGGHSLLAMQLVTRIRHSIGREVSLRDLFEHPTVQTLARRLVTASESSRTPIVPADRNQPLPLSLTQQRIWLETQLEGASVAYHMSLRLRIRGGLDQDALQRALDTIVHRHEALRTRFSSVAGQALQTIAPDLAGLPLRIVDLSCLAPVERDAQAATEIAEEVRASFDLSTGPVIRGRLIRLGSQEHVLQVTIHHIVADGWSLGVLVNELGVLYGAYREGRPNPLRPLPIQYA
ncbi:MAG TPA: amino acid adenylation domain-containing protein, partial [Steroidobacteraceae bacterium]